MIEVPNRREWQLVSLGVAVIGVVGSIDCFLPWYRTVGYEQAGNTFAARPVTAWDSDGFTITVIAYFLVAIMLGLFCRARHPGDPRLVPTMFVTVLCPALGLVMVPIPLFTGTQRGSELAPAYGSVVALVLLAGWLVCAVLQRRWAAAARSSGRVSW